MASNKLSCHMAAVACLGMIPAPTFAQVSLAVPASGVDSNLSPKQVEALVGEAFYWGINIAGFYELRHVFSQLKQAPAYRGINRLQPLYRLMDAKARYATTINASTLYSGGVFDVSKEPVVVEIDPTPPGRYWSVQVSDQYARWTILDGSQFGGGAKTRFLLVGPNWRGQLPSSFHANEIIRLPSSSFTVTMRVGVTDRSDADLASARSFVDKMRAAPLSLWTQAGKKLPALAEQPILAGLYRSFPRMQQISDIGKTMTGVDLLRLLSLAVNDESLTLKKDSVQETRLLAKIAALGVRSGSLFDPGKMTEAQRQAIERGYAAARLKARSALHASFIDMQGWKLQSDLFDDPHNLVARAGAQDVAWGTPVPYQSHTIAYLFQDSCGHRLNSDRRYTVTFDMKNLPPVTEFWELPVYDADGYFIDNPINRYSVTSSLAKSGAYLVEKQKLTFTFSRTPPEKSEERRNWLPLPSSGAFQIAARFYGPLAPLVDGSYQMPKLIPTDAPNCQK